MLRLRRAEALPYFVEVLRTYIASPQDLPVLSEEFIPMRRDAINSDHIVIVSASSNVALAHALISAQYTSAFSMRTPKIVFAHVVLLITGTPSFDLNLKVRLPLSTLSLICFRIVAGDLFSMMKSLNKPRWYSQPSLLILLECWTMNVQTVKLWTIP